MSDNGATKQHDVRVEDSAIKGAPPGSAEAQPPRTGNGEVHMPSPTARHGAATTPATRRPGTNVSSSTAPKAATLTPPQGNRTAGGLSKPPTRPPVPGTRRPTTSSTSAASHRSRPSVSASEDEKKPSPGSATARRASSLMSSPGRGVDKKASGPPGAIPTSRRPAATAAAGTSRPSGAVSSTRVGTNGSTAAAPRTGATRSAATTGAASSKKRTSTVGTSASTTRAAPQTVAKPNSSAEAAKEMDELKSKLEIGNAEIESLRISVKAAEDIITQLREELDSVAFKGPHPDQESDATSAAHTVATLQEQLAAASNNLDAATAEIENHKANAEKVTRVKEDADAELAALKKSLWTVEAEAAERLKTSETALQKTINQHTSEMEDLRTSLAEEQKLAMADLMAEHRRELERGNADASAHQSALTSLQSTHESTVAELKTKIDELTASQTALESGHRDRSKSEQEAYSVKISALETEISALTREVETSREVAKLTKSEADNTGDEITRLQESLAEKDKELIGVSHELSSLQASAAETQRNLTLKDSEVSKLKTMHDERMKQISQDYENEIESLRGDAFFKRKYEELDGQYSELVAASTEAEQNHLRSLESAKTEHDQTLAELQSNKTQHEKNLGSLRESHAEELKIAMKTATEERERHAAELDTLKTMHMQQTEVLKNQGDDAHAKDVTVLEDSHTQLIETLKKDHAKERDTLQATHETELAAAKNEGFGVYEAELAKLKAEVNSAQAELEKAQLSSTEAMDVAKREAHDAHTTEVEKLITMHTEAMETLKAEGAGAKKDLEELAATHTKAIEDLMSDYRNNNTTFEEKLSQQTAANAELQAALNAAQESLAIAVAEAEDASQQLAHEKTGRVAALADLDAVRSTKPDTSELDGLKQELAAMRKSRDESLHLVQDDLRGKSSEVDSIKGEMESYKQAVKDLQTDLDLAQKGQEAYKAEADARHKTSQADYQDLNDSMTALVEEANNKTKIAEMKFEESKKSVEDGEKSVEELRAQLKVKDAELSEAKAQIGTSRHKGLASSRFANADENNGVEDARDNAAEGEDDDNHSSAALASLSKARLTAKQIDALDREMRDRNLQLLNSITNVNNSTLEVD